MFARWRQENFFKSLREEYALQVRLAPLSSPHRTRALAALCAELDRVAIRFPGTRLRLRYAVATPD
jgi:hypothetical protein